MLTAAQLCVLLRAIVNLDPYTFANDLAEDTADENDKRSAEEVSLATIDGTANDKLTGFAVRLALSGHRAIPREGEHNFLSEAAAAFLTPKPKKIAANKAVPARKKPTPIKPAKTATKKARSEERHSAAYRERRRSLTRLGAGSRPPPPPPHSSKGASMNNAAAISAVNRALAHYRRRQAHTPTDHSAREIAQSPCLPSTCTKCTRPTRSEEPNRKRFRSSTWSPFR